MPGARSSRTSHFRLAGRRRTCASPTIAVRAASLLSGVKTSKSLISGTLLFDLLLSGTLLAGMLLATATARAETEPSSPGRVSEDAVLAGRTLADWQTFFKTIEFDSPEAAAEVDALRRLLKEPAAPAVARLQAALTLGRIGRRAANSVPDLAALLDETTPADNGDPPRYWGLKGLALLGPAAADAAPAVISVLHGESSSHLDRLLAIEALGRIGPTHPQTLAAVVQILERPPPSPAPSPLTHMGSPTEVAAPAEAERVHAETRELRLAAIDVLSLFKASAAPALPALLQALRDDEELLRRSAAMTLGAAQSPLAIEPLHDALTFDDSPAVRDAAAAALGQIGLPALPTLTALLADDDPDTRQRAAAALRRLGPPALPAIERLRPLLRDPSPTVRLSAAQAVWEIAADADAALEPPLELLGAPDRETRMAAHRLILAIGRRSPSEALLRRLQSLSESRDPRVRQAAVIALREIALPAP